MANILDYLDWRGDLSFEQSPFNEVDGLILAQLSYVFFDGILTEGFDNILTLSEAHSRLNFDSIDEKLRFFSFDYDRILLQKMANSKRFGNMPLTGYVSITDPKNEVQFAALTCILDDKTKYISYRGTDASIVGWREDFNLSYMTRTAGQKYAVDYLNRHFGTQDDISLSCIFDKQLVKDGADALKRQVEKNKARAEMRKAEQQAKLAKQRLKNKLRRNPNLAVEE